MMTREDAIREIASLAATTAGVGHYAKQRLLEISKLRFDGETVFEPLEPEQEPEAEPAHKSPKKKK